LNPFDVSRVPSSWGTDTNVALFESSLAAMRRAVPNPAVVVLPGDFFMHHFPQASLRPRTIRRIVHDLDRAFAHAQFVVVLGNNDSACGDYRSELGSGDLRAMARAWAPLVDRNGAAPDFEQSFARSGHYTARLPLAHLRLVAIDTVLFSSLYRGDCNGAASPAAAELQWLHNTLAATPPGERNVVAMHVPPGYDVFATEMARGFVPWPLMRPNFGTEVANELATPEHRVAFAIAGHEHHFDVRLAGDVPIVALGSISPVYENSPAFYALSVDANGTLRDVRAWAFDENLRSWSPPRDFDRMWNLAAIDGRALRSLHERLGTDAESRRAWEALANGWSTGASDFWGARWRIPWCAQVEFGKGFERCAHLGRRVTLARIAVAAAIVALLTLAAVLVRAAVWGRGGGRRVR
jgi:sphingomyelin phosphodiesterase acid-like 3